MVFSNIYDINEARSINVEKNISENNAISSFNATFDNPAGRHSSDFEVGKEVIISANKTGVFDDNDIIFRGKIEDISFSGEGVYEQVIISGRDYGSVLQDIIVKPRVFKNLEVSEIILQLINQNIPSITTNNVNVTTTTIEKMTFTNISVFDAINKLAQESGFMFYVDANLDLHFELKELTSSGITLDNTNVLSANFDEDDSSICNRVTVYGDKQLTGKKEDFLVSTGSVFTLEDKPSNTRLFLSGAVNTTIQPGGVFYLNDPATESAKYLVDYQARKIILTSGTTAGNNIIPAGSKIIIEYDRSVPILRARENATSQQLYGIRDKVIIDTNIKDPIEATQRAVTTLSENAYPTKQGELEVKNVLNVTPGNTILVNFPNQDVNNETYQIVSAKYSFTKENNLRNRTLKLKVNKKNKDFLDIFKDEMLRIRSIEASQIDSNIIDLQSSITTTFVMSDTRAVRRTIGSGFYFHVSGHDLFNSPKSLLGDVRGGQFNNMGLTTNGLNVFAANLTGSALPNNTAIGIGSNVYASGNTVLVSQFDRNTFTSYDLSIPGEVTIISNFSPTETSGLVLREYGTYTLGSTLINREVLTGSSVFDGEQELQIQQTFKFVISG